MNIDDMVAEVLVLITINNRSNDYGLNDVEGSQTGKRIQSNRIECQTQFG